MNEITFELVISIFIITVLFIVQSIMLATLTQSEAVLYYVLGFLMSRFIVFVRWRR